MLRLIGLLVGLALTINITKGQGVEPLRADALQTMRKAAVFYRSKVASHGGYVYYYSVDLQKQWGEGATIRDTIFVQPPGTPTVGMAFLQAYKATGDTYYLDAAREAASALIYGQLESGGWTQAIHFAKNKRMGKYRNGNGGSWNNSSLDDGQSQSALQFLMETDQSLKFNDKAIHEATIYGLDALLKAQFDNGAFPQVWQNPSPHRPIVNAKYPVYDWKTEGRLKNYWDYYTLNDSLAGTVCKTLIKAYTIYKDARYLKSLEKLGDFLVLAQMPEPQPGWCQQYNFNMVPIWARKFEPPAIAGSESQDVMETLIAIANLTGNHKYLEPIPKALQYFESRCLLAGSTLARYYELKTNKPLYVDAKYQLTYDSSNAPSHYSWHQQSRLKSIKKSYSAIQNEVEVIPADKKQVEVQDIQSIINSLDNEGRWISIYAGERLVGQPKFAKGFQYISSELFSSSMLQLANYIGER